MPGEERDILLIVDDDAINRAILEQIFADDYVVLEAENGRAGLARILEGPERLCAVLLDVVMPEMDGLTLLERLRALYSDSCRYGIFCGSGNNGGDGFALALLLKDLQLPFVICAVDGKRSPAAAYYAEQLQREAKELLVGVLRSRVLVRQ